MQVRLALIGELTVGNILDWLIAGLLVATVCLNIFQLGGVRAETQLISIWMTGVLVVLHGFGILTSVKDRQYTCQWYGLLLVPFLAYALLHWLVLSPVRWDAQRDLILLLQAFILFWVTLNNFRNREQVWFVLAAICLFSALTVLTAYNQYYRRPEWAPKLFSPFEGGTMKLNLDLAHKGKAAGTLGAPGSYAGLMLLVVFPFIVSAFTKRFPAVIRFFCGFMIIMVMSGIALTHSISAILSLAVGCLLAPLLLAYKPRWRIYSFLLAILAVLVLLAALYFGNLEFREQMMAYLSGDFSDPRPPLWIVALQGFLADPVFGQGMSSFAWNFESMRPAGYNYDPLYAHSDVLNFLNDFGVVGVVLLGLPVAWLLLKANRVLGAQEQFVLLEHPVKMKVVPTKRIYLAAILLSFLAFGIDSLFQFHLRVPALLFTAAVFFGVMVKCLPGQALSIAAGKGRGLMVLILSVLIAFFLISISQGYLVSQAYAFEGNRRLHQAAGQQLERIPQDPDAANNTISILELAAGHDPDNPRIWSDLARATLNLQYIQPSQFETFGRQAELYIRKAQEIDEGNAHDWLILGTALWMQQQYDASGEAFRHAVELAPNSSQAWYYLAAYLNLNPQTRDEALTAVDRSLELKPGDPNAEDLRLKILIP